MHCLLNDSKLIINSTKWYLLIYFSRFPYTLNCKHAYLNKDCRSFSIKTTKCHDSITFDMSIASFIRAYENNNCMNVCVCALKEPIFIFCFFLLISLYFV